MGAVAAEAPRAGETELIFGLVYRARIRRRRFFPLILGKLGPDHHTQKSHHDRTPNPAPIAVPVQPSSDLLPVHRPTRLSPRRAPRRWRRRSPCLRSGGRGHSAGLLNPLVGMENTEAALRSQDRSTSGCRPRNRLVPELRQRLGRCGLRRGWRYDSERQGPDECPSCLRPIHESPEYHPG